jgi:hypothetical protein
VIRVETGSRFPVSVREGFDYTAGRAVRETVANLDDRFRRS